MSMSIKKHVEKVYKAEADAADYASDPEAFMRRSMKIIIENRDDFILQVRAARAALSYWDKHEGKDFVIKYEDGSVYLVRRNKNSVRVYGSEGNK